MSKKYSSVPSSHLESVYHDNSTNSLYVKFQNGKTYRYHGVSASQYKSLMNAKSHGEYFHANIKKKHLFDKV